MRESRLATHAAVYLAIGAWPSHLAFHVADCASTAAENTAERDRIITVNKCRSIGATRKATVPSPAAIALLFYNATSRCAATRKRASERQTRITPSSAYVQAPCLNANLLAAFGNAVAPSPMLPANLRFAGTGMK